MSMFTLQVPGHPAYVLGPETPVLTVGRATQNDIAIPDPSLSRAHARISLEDGAVFLEDLGSRNGTTVNGERLTGRRQVGAEDYVLFGSVPLRVASKGAAPSKVLIDHSGPDALESAAFVGSARELWEGEATVAADRRASTRASAPPDRWHQALGLLQELSLGLIRECTPRQLLEDLMDKLFAFLNADRGLVLLREGDGTPVPWVVRTKEGFASKGTIRLSHTLVEAALDRGEAILLRDTSDPKLASKSLIVSGVTTAIVTPLEAEGQIIGLLYFDAYVMRDPFDENELRVAATVAHLAAAKIQNGRLMEEVQRKRALEQEMAIATSIQRQMLPQKMPEGMPFELHAELRPAKEVGGDLYDFFVKEGRLLFCIGDVSGKGVPAALVMALTKTLFRAYADFLGDPALVLAAMNVRLCEETDSRIFVTVFCASLDLASGRLAYCNAGHDRPLLLQGGKPIRCLEARPGLALGVLPNYPYATQVCELEPGESLLLFTDGVTEATDPALNLFTLERLQGSLLGHETQSPAALAESVLAAVDAFAQDSPQADDITVMGLRFQEATR